MRKGWFENMSLGVGRFFLLSLLVLSGLSLAPLQAQELSPRTVALVPYEWTPTRSGPLGSAGNPHLLLDLIREPELILPGHHVAIPRASGEEVMLLPGEQEQFSAAAKWAHTKALLGKAGWPLPAALQKQSVSVRSIRVRGTASTYGRNDGFAGQLTSSGKVVNASTAALQMDLAHVLADLKVVPFSMRGVKATLTMPSGKKVAKNLEDKGGLVNYLGEAYWRRAIKTMTVDANGVGTLAPLPASHYRVVDIFTQRRSTLIPNVTVEIHLKTPLVRKLNQTPEQCQSWLRDNFQPPKLES